MHRVIDTYITVYPFWTQILATIFSCIAIFPLAFSFLDKSMVSFLVFIACIAIAWVPFGTQYHRGIDKQDQVQVTYNSKPVWVPAVKMENGEWHPKTKE